MRAARDFSRKTLAAPERIWANGLGVYGEYGGFGGTEYAHADLLAAAEVRAEQAEARERALLASNNDTRLALVENASLRTRLKSAEAEAKRLRAALSLYSCKDGCNDCPEHERDRVNCGWTARAALREGGDNV
jgi:hypothetical protein